MKKLIAIAIMLALVLTVASAAEGVGDAYPSSGVTPPEGSAIIKGELIGLEVGWGENADAGRAAAFDGDIFTFFDPLGTGDGYAGIDAGEEYILTYIVIHPRDGFLDRFDGAEINGSNDGENWDLIWMNEEGEAAEWDWQKIPADQFKIKDTGYRYYRYYNELMHGDVGEVELYGYSKAAAEAAAAAAAEPEPVIEEAPVEAAPEPAAEPAPVAEAAPAAAAPAPAPQTSDITALAVAAAVMALGSAALVSKKRR
ncbi:MAG TPA: discoidin domain-containing protein [Clostridiales bacterium]|jgi:pyruvate/2-oxoglutarate dehydrogenase complex dihydrolipoamide acyltransferase (E2) component|nr:discoidin domain-containing protein [Clostridiales bacterium]